MCEYTPEEVSAQYRKMMVMMMMVMMNPKAAHCIIKSANELIIIDLFSFLKSFECKLYSQYLLVW